MSLRNYAEPGDRRGGDEGRMTEGVINERADLLKDRLAAGEMGGCGERETERERY